MVQFTNADVKPIVEFQEVLILLFIYKVSNRSIKKIPFCK